ncbi:casein kinase II subunit alpha-like protein [Tanacetum coccineum]|uniref:non-specific serine/threonine protein kinase n=1 Tax=Tanacetum coccineum TaxID=301880 RepID=A0ABQ4ZL41_9ASTR
MNRGVSSGGGQSSLNYLFGGEEEPKPALKATQAALAANNISAAKPDPVSPLVDVTKLIPAGTSVTRKESRALNEAKKRRVDKGKVVSESYEELKEGLIRVSSELMEYEIKDLMDTVLESSLRRQSFFHLFHRRVAYQLCAPKRYFKGPELLVDLQDYDYSLDLWSLGCMFFARNLFFSLRKDNYDQLVKVSKVLGIDKLKTYLQRYLLELDPHLVALVGRHSRKLWTKFINFNNQHLAVPKAVDFLDKLLRYDHQERPTAKKAMVHPYFYAIRNAESNRTHA